MLCCTKQVITLNILLLGYLNHSYWDFTEYAQDRKISKQPPKCCSQLRPAEGIPGLLLRKSLKTVQQTKPILVATALPCITTYSPSAVKLVRVIKNNFNHFMRRTGLLQDHRIIAHSEKTRIYKTIGSELKSNHYLTLNLKVMEFFQYQTWLRNKFNNNVFKTQCNRSPSSKNCVYLITRKQRGI